MFSPKEENVRKKFSQKMFKNMKHFPNMFKKSVVLSIQSLNFRLTARYPQDVTSKKVQDGDILRPIFNLYGSQGAPDDDKTFDIFVQLKGMTKVETRTSKNA